MSTLSTREKSGFELAPWAVHILAAGACLFTVIIVGVSFADMIPLQWNDGARTAALTASFGGPAVVAWLIYWLLSRPEAPQRPRR